LPARKAYGRRQWAIAFFDHEMYGYAGCDHAQRVRHIGDRPELEDEAIDLW
jgi:hypothetical protein